MAQRPLVLVYQEYATLTSTPSTPELECLIGGPCYWIKDYPEDKAAMLLATGTPAVNRTYGTANATAPYTPPAAGVLQFTLTEPPTNKAGAVLDGDSLRLWMDYVRVRMVQDGDTVNSVVMSVGTTVASTPTLTLSGLGSFLDAAVQAGDLVVMTAAGGTTPTVVRVVRSVTATVITFTSDMPTAPEFTAGVAIRWRVERVFNDQEVPATCAVKVAGTNNVRVYGGATVDVDGVAKDVCYCGFLYLSYRSLRTDLQTVGVINSVSEITTLLGTIDARNPLAVGAWVAKQNTPTWVKFFGIATDDLVGYTDMKDYLAAEEEIYAIVPLSQDIAVPVMFKTDLENMADPDYALTNGVPQKFRSCIAAPGPLPTEQTMVDEAVVGKVETFAGTAPTTPSKIDVTGATFLTSLVVAGDTIRVSADTHGVPRDGDFTVVEVLSETCAVVAQAFAANATANATVAVLAPSGATRMAAVVGGATVTASGVVKAALVGATFITSGVLPGDLFKITVDASTPTRVATYTVAQVLSETELLVDTDEVFVEAATGNVTANVDTPAGAARMGAVAAAALTTSVGPALYLDLYDSTAAFLDDGVIAGDILEMPYDPSGHDFTDHDSWVVASVVSNQRLRVVNGGRSTATAANELPYGATRHAMVKTVPTTAVCGYRVVRTLSKAGQVTQLIAWATSMASRRIAFCWPDLCDVAGLVDGSLDRADLDVPEAANSQPGYYLGCAMGGMTAGLPSHQGFTRMGIAGVSKLYHSKGWFSDRQITQISNSGWTVFQQDAEGALPYAVHSLTTDPTTLEFGEFMMVKNFDYVAMYLRAYMDAFIGVWNVNAETVGFIETALDTGCVNLRLKKRAKIGSPINSYAITQVAESSVSSDRVEAYVELDFPAPLNTVGMHLVSI